MDIETLRHYCLSKNAATEDMPFDDKTLVFRVMNKMFGLLSLDSENVSINLKCTPGYAVELRELYPDDIKPGYHMSKIHWNTVRCDGALNDSLVRELVTHSYDLIVQSLTKAQREALKS